MNINWDTIEEEFYRELCGYHYTRLEVNTDDPIKVFNWFKTKVNAQLKIRKINALERSKGRSENYYQLSAEQQWEEDKRLGILDWDGK